MTDEKYKPILSKLCVTKKNENVGVQYVMRFINYSNPESEPHKYPEDAQIYDHKKLSNMSSKCVMSSTWQRGASSVSLDLVRIVRK